MVEEPLDKLMEILMEVEPLEEISTEILMAVASVASVAESLEVALVPVVSMVAPLVE